MDLVWVVTAGNSDCKLDREDGFSYLRTEKNAQLKPCQKKFATLIQGDDYLFSLPARVMGIVYGDALETHKDYFIFPLLEELTAKLKNKDKIPNRIIILLTNQEEIFLEDSEDPLYDRSEGSPYWRDTSHLEPILKHYFHQEFGGENIQLSFPLLKPNVREKGLDNWDSTLELVQNEFEKWAISENDHVIVSHQASTPAISSAVQFVSLAKFGEKVTFLVSNERDSNLARFLEGSAYLKGIRKKEAETLLERYDYSGVKSLVKSYINKDGKLQALLDAAILWNQARFEEFSNLLDAELKARTQEWWWTGYESAYLAVIRLEQGSTVEALFHSFRAAEGSISNWAKWYYPEDIQETKKGAPIVKYRPNSLLPTSLVEKVVEITNKELLLYSEELFELLKKTRPAITNNEDVKAIWSSARSIRNQQFHRLLGLDEREVFRAWGTKENRASWKDRLRNCLNTISGQTFGSLEEVSLMAKVHKELKSAIAHL